MMERSSELLNAYQDDAEGRKERYPRLHCDSWGPYIPQSPPRPRKQSLIDDDVYEVSALKDLPQIKIRPPSTGPESSSRASSHRSSRSRSASNCSRQSHSDSDCSGLTADSVSPDELLTPIDTPREAFSLVNIASPSPISPVGYHFEDVKIKELPDIVHYQFQQHEQGPSQYTLDRSTYDRYVTEHGLDLFVMADEPWAHHTYQSLSPRRQPRHSTLLELPCFHSHMHNEVHQSTAHDAERKSHRCLTSKYALPTQKISASMHATDTVAFDMHKIPSPRFSQIKDPRYEPFDSASIRKSQCEMKFKSQNPRTCSAHCSSSWCLDDDETTENSNGAFKQAIDDALTMLHNEGPKLEDKNFNRRLNLVDCNRSKFRSPSPPKQKSTMYTRSQSMSSTHGMISDWQSHVQNVPNTPPNQVSPMSSGSIAAEEDLERRVCSTFGDDPSFAEALLSNLKEKITFILPLFVEDEDRGSVESLLGATPLVFEQGQTQGTTPSSGNSTAYKGSNSSLSDTPNTSTGTNEDDGKEEDDDMPPNKRRKLDRQRPTSGPRAHSIQGKRRLRCHFHAKSPEKHNKKTCSLSPGWLSIHNLRGHYETHHTVIRCSKCFQEFPKKTEKNSHLEECTTRASPPPLEVIDCNRSDEIDEAMRALRVWKLESEHDEEMKAWIMKYKSDLITGTKDDTHDSRELAKWFKYWRILFPDFEGPVPSPFQTSPASPGELKLERFLEVFQTLLETKLERNQPPPSEYTRQFQYYADVIRDVYNLVQPSSSSGSLPSPEGTSPSVTRHDEVPKETVTNESEKPYQTPQTIPDQALYQGYIPEANGAFSLREYYQSAPPPLHLANPIFHEHCQTKNQGFQIQNYNNQAHVQSGSAGFPGSNLGVDMSLDSVRTTCPPARPQLIQHSDSKASMNNRQETRSMNHHGGASDHGMPSVHGSTLENSHVLYNASHLGTSSMNRSHPLLKPIITTDFGRTLRGVSQEDLLEEATMLERSNFTSCDDWGSLEWMQSDRET